MLQNSGETADHDTRNSKLASDTGIDFRSLGHFDTRHGGLIRRPDVLQDRTPGRGVW